MLPKELLMVRKRKGSIMPCYLSDTTIAKELIHLYTQSIGKKYKQILRDREALEGHDFKVVRGLSTLLERRCIFSSDSTIPGRDIREFLFKQGFVTTLEAREKRLEEAATIFMFSKEEVEASIFSDLLEEQVLTDFKTIDPLDLTRDYNLALTQTVLFDALGLSFTVSSNHQQIFRKIKYLGLMYEIDEKIRVTGPGSLFKKNRRYGTALAKLIPEIMNAKGYEIQAIIETTAGGEPRVFTFDLDSNNKILFPKTSEPVTHFDSMVEQQFYQDMNALHLGWEIIREPNVIKAGEYAVIPDFGFYKDDMRLYLEIVGFWTKEYLTKKVNKLHNAQADIIVAVNEQLGCSTEDFPHDVIMYRQKIPLLNIVRLLREAEERHVEKQLQTMEQIHISSDVCMVQDLAKTYQVNPKTIIRLDIPGYQMIGDQIISKKLLQTVKEELKEFEAYNEVEKILLKHQLSPLVLDVLGFRVIWEGLQPTKVVEKKKD